MVEGTELEGVVIRSLRLHDRYLRSHLERDVGGNHLLKNLKALVGLAKFFERAADLKRALAMIEREVSTQILPDGGHYERAPAYHCQVLGDLIDVANLLGSETPEWLGDVIHRMRRWLGLMLLPDGSVPLLNDGYPVSSALLTALEPGPTAGEGLTHLADSGYVVMRRGEVFVLADVGDPCPDELPAHSHADALGFLAYFGEQRVVGEVQTSTYDAGPVRSYERGTAGHSTVQVDGLDSTEVWGAFRAGRRSRSTVHEIRQEGPNILLVASHDGFSVLPGRPRHTRTWFVHARGIRILDRVDGKGTHQVSVRFHQTSIDTNTVSSAPLDRYPAPVALSWNRVGFFDVLEWTGTAVLPWSFEVALNSEGRA